MHKVKLKQRTSHECLYSNIWLVYALYNMAYSMGMFLGPVYAGAVMAVAGFKTLMFTFAIALVICSPVMMDWKAVWRRLRDCVRSHWYHISFFRYKSMFPHPLKLCNAYTMNISLFEQAVRVWRKYINVKGGLDWRGGRKRKEGDNNKIIFVDKK